MLGTKDEKEIVVKMLKFKWETEFKQTEIGEIPKDWKEKTLNEIMVSIQKGKTPIKKYENKGDYPYLSAKYLRGEEEPSEFYSKEAGFIVNEDDLIILWDGSNSGEIFRGIKGILASTMAKLKFKEEVNNDFMFSALKSIEEEIKDAKSGTDDRHVDKDYFLNLSIFSPSSQEQSRIATVLSWFDDLNREQE